MISKEITITSLILSANRALLSEVRANLRSVYVDYKNETNTITLLFYFDGPLSNDELENDVAGIVLAQMMGDFPSDINWEDKVIELPYPKKIPNKGICVFSRYEPPSEN